MHDTDDARVINDDFDSFLDSIIDNNFKFLKDWVEHTVFLFYLLFF